jgi:hypothetical protein
MKSYLEKFRFYLKGFLAFLRSPIGLILILALLVRIAFTLFVAKAFFGRENIYVDGDTYAWASAIQSLIDTGTYTVNPGLGYGYFGRMPGYSFFIGIFYLLSGKSWDLAFPIIAFVQILLDVIAVYLVYKIAVKLSSIKLTGLIAAFLYAFYPFVIVWTPVVYSELFGMFLLILSFWLMLSDLKWNYFYGAFILALAALCRPQTLLIVPMFAIFILFNNAVLFRKRIISLCCFGLIFVTIYGIWPARNYLGYQKVILTQDLRGFYNWNEDVLSFLQYIYSVKAEWEPQYSQLIKNQHVVFPKEAYLTTEDSLKLEQAVYLAQHCGSGFSHKSGFWKLPFDTPNCNDQIKRLFQELRENQVKNNKFNFYVKVPVQNLKKALLKSNMVDSKSLARKLASLLFYYRTLLILLGIAGVFVMWRKYPGARLAALVIIGYFLILYLTICAGTSVQLRNIEMRYFLPADLLLIIPASFLLQQFKK